MKLVIPGEPISKARHRSCLRGGRIMQYDVQDKEKKTVKVFMSEWIKDIWNSSEKKVVMEISNICHASSLRLNFVFYMPYPRCLNSIERGLIEWGKRLHTEKPDLDNLVKFYLDCMNGVLFEDDRQVTKLTACKKYSKDPRVEVEIISMRTKGKPNISECILAQFTQEELTQLVGLVEALRRLLRPFEWTLEDECEEEELLKKMHLKVGIVLSEIAEKYTLKLSKIKKLAPGYYKGIDYAVEEREEQESNLREYCYRDTRGEAAEASGCDSTKCGEESGCKKTKKEQVNNGQENSKVRETSQDRVEGA